MNHLLSFFIPRIKLFLLKAKAKWMDELIVTVDSLVSRLYRFIVFLGRICQPMIYSCKLL